MNFSTAAAAAAALSHSGQAALCSNSFKSFKFSSCPCTSTATGRCPPPPQAAKGSKAWTFLLLLLLLQLCLTQAKQHCVQTLSSYSNFLALAPAQPLQEPTTTTGSKAWTFLLLQLACCLTQAKPSQAALCSIQFSFNFSCLPLHQLRPSSTVFHSIFIQIFLPLPLPLHQHSHHCRHSLLSSTKGGNRLWFTVCTSLPGQTAPFHLSTFEISTTKGGNRLWFTLWLSPRPNSTISSLNFWNLFPSWIFWARRVEMNNGSFVWILHGPKITPHIFQMEDPKNIEFFSKFWYKIREAKIAPCHLTTTNQTFLKSVGMDKTIWKGFRPLRPSRSKLLAFEIYEAKLSLFTTWAKNWTKNIQNFKTNHKIAEVEKSRGNKVQQTVSRSRPNWRNGSLVNFSYWIYWIKESV